MYLYLVMRFGDLQMGFGCRFKCYHQGPRAKDANKKMTIFFLFILVRTTTKSIQFINKPVFFVLVLLAKQQQQESSIYIQTQYAMLFF
jgi:hypothetical protein